MKTILVLTDFSISADYTADYALALAQQMETNLLLCNIFERPADEAVPDHKTWPRQACEENSIHDLGALMARLKTKQDKEPVGSAYKPEINQCSIDSSVEKELGAMIIKHEVSLAIISAHTHHNFGGLFQKNHAWEIINRASFPVLVIPYQTRFKPFRQISFATAMYNSDIEVLQSVAKIAQNSNSELLITYVTQKPQGQHALQRFFNQMPFNITYPKISYNTIKADNVVRFLKKQCTYIDLLVLVHHKRNFLQNLFGGSITRKMALRPLKPLLIFPDKVIN